MWVLEDLRLHVSNSMWRACLEEGKVNKINGGPVRGLSGPKETSRVSLLGRWDKVRVFKELENYNDLAEF